MAVPSVAIRYDSGRFGAAAYRKCKPSFSTRKIEHSIPWLCASIKRVMLVRTSARDVPIRINFSESSTASADNDCEEASDVEDAWFGIRVGFGLSAICPSPVAGGRSIAQIL